MAVEMLFRGENAMKWAKIKEGRIFRCPLPVCLDQIIRLRMY